MPSSPSTSILSDANLGFVSSTPASSPGTTFKNREHEKDDRWVEKIEIPSTFSDRSMDFLCTEILTQNCKTEIVQTVAAHMWVTPIILPDLRTIPSVQNLLKYIRKLADDAGDQVAFVSYSMYVPYL